MKVISQDSDVFICQIFKDFDSRVTRVDKDDLTITDQIAGF